MNDLDSRIARLEKQNRWLRAVSIAALAVAIIPVFLGSRFAAEGDVVKAKAFLLIDDDGNPKGAWGILSNGKKVQFLMAHDAKESGPSISLWIDKEDAMIGTKFDGKPNIILNGNTLGGLLHAKTGGKMKTAVTEE